jgi:hypothetical protein
MGTEHTTTAAKEHKKAAEQNDRARGLVGQALGEIDDISRGMKESMPDKKRLPSESEMQEADEVAKANNLSPAERHADQARRDY